MNTQLVLIEFRNTDPFIERLTSSEKITLDRVVAFIDERDGFDEERDAITLIDEPDDTCID